jgi:hypothetical protein
MSAMRSSVESNSAISSQFSSLFPSAPFWPSHSQRQSCAAYSLRRLSSLSTFTVLILYSYRIHAVLTRYLRETLEPELAAAIGSTVDLELETYYSKHAVAGIRKTFFIAALWIVTLSSLAYLWASEPSQSFVNVLSVFAALYLGACGIIHMAFRK